MAVTAKKTAIAYGLLVCLSVHLSVHLYLSQKTWQQVQQQTIPPAAAPAATRSVEDPGKPKRLPNPYNFSFPINVADVCHKDSVDVIMPVSTALYNFDKRQVFRNSTQARYAADKKNGLKILYFVGIPSKKLANWTQFQDSLRNESALYGDVVQVQLEETYLNLVYKSLAVMYWVENYCRDATFVLRTDDDIDINATAAVLALNRNRKYYQHFMLGHTRAHARPVRVPSHKYYVSFEEFPDKIFPPHLAGPAMGYPRVTSRQLYQEAVRSKTFWIEDVFYSGMVRRALGIPLISDAAFQTNLIHRTFRPRRGDVFLYS